MKRSNGSGSVYKLSGNRRKPWIAIVVLGSDEGKFIRKTVGYYATKAEAEVAIALDRAIPSSEDQYIKLKDLFAKWKKTRAYTEIKKTTQSNYDAAFKYFREFHNMQFANLRTTHWQKAIDLAAETGKSHSTMTKIKVLAGILSEFALSEDIVNKAYYSTVRIPKESRKKQIPTFTEKEIDALFQHSDDSIAASALILIYTGMRITEMLQLRKEHIDINQMFIVGGIKTEAGTDRTIPIHPKIQPIILRFYNENKTYLLEYNKEMGNKKKGTKRIVRVKYRYEYYCDLYFEKLEQLGIRRLTPHKARHTFFTRLSERCKDRKGIALVGGHTDPDFTAKVYDHPDLERLRKVIDCL